MKRAGLSAHRTLLLLLPLVLIWEALLKRGRCFATILVLVLAPALAARAFAANEEDFKVLRPMLVLFKKEQWSRGDNIMNPSFFTYKATVVDARMDIYVENVGLLKFTAKTNARLIIRGHFAHLDEEVKQDNNLNAIAEADFGYKALFGKDFRFQKEKWDLLGPTAAGWFRYKANAANAILTAIPPNNTILFSTFRAENAAQVWVFDEAVHLGPDVTIAAAQEEPEAE